MYSPHSVSIRFARERMNIHRNPAFQISEVTSGDGKTITFKADNNQLDNRYIKEMKVNGKSQTRNFLTHDQLIKGANIQFQMSPVPNKQRGTTEKDVPYSLSFE